MEDRRLGLGTWPVPASRSPFERLGRPVDVSRPAWDSRTKVTARSPSAVPPWRTSHASPQRSRAGSASSRDSLDSTRPQSRARSQTDSPASRSSRGGPARSRAAAPEVDRLAQLIDDNRELLRELQARARGGSTGSEAAPSRASEAAPARVSEAWSGFVRPPSAATHSRAGSESDADEAPRSLRLAALQQRVEEAELRARGAAEAAEGRAEAAEAARARAEAEAARLRETVASLERGSEEERREGAALLAQLQELQSWSRDTAGQLQGLRQAAQQLSAGAGSMEAVAEERARAAQAAQAALELQNSLRAQLSEAHTELSAAQLRAASAMREAAQSAEAAAEARRAEAEAREAAGRSGAVAAAALQALQALKNALLRDDGSLEALRAELSKVDLEDGEQGEGPATSPARLLEAAMEAAGE